jgi:general secretion pathway protein G
MKKSVRTAQAGFSLIEILLVMGIIAFIATLVANNLVGNAQKAKYAGAKAGVQKVALAASNFYIDVGQIPGSIEQLMTAPSNTQNWKGPYLQKSQLLDPWDNPYMLKVDSKGSQGFVVISLASDKAEGGEGYAKDLSSSD